MRTAFVNLKDLTIVLILKKDKESRKEIANIYDQDQE